MNNFRSMKFDSVYILESLPANDLKTGTILFNEEISPTIATIPNFESHLIQIDNKNKFFQSLEHLTEDSIKRNRSPILHIESHGCEEGIGLISNEFISWEELKPLMVNINEISRLNLLVIVSACSGAHLMKVVSPIDRAPVWGIIGPKNPISERELINDFTRFYRELFKTLDGNSALIKLNGSGPNKDWRYLFIPAEWMFKRAYQKYMKNYGTKEAINMRVEEALSNIRNNHNLGEGEESGFRAKFRDYVSDHTARFEKFRRHFFMIDLDPNNELRFPLTFEEVNSDS